MHPATHPLQLPHQMDPCFRWKRLAVDRGLYPISVQADRGRIIVDRPFLRDGVAQLSVRSLRCGKVAVDLLPNAETIQHAFIVKTVRKMSRSSPSSRERTSLRGRALKGMLVAFASAAAFTEKRRSFGSQETGGPQCHPIWRSPLECPLLAHPDEVGC